MSEPKPRTSLEFLEHLLEVGDWDNANGEALEREAREIVEPHNRGVARQCQASAGGSSRVGRRPADRSDRPPDRGQPLMLRSLYRFHLEALAAYGDWRAERRLRALDRLERMERVRWWRSLLELADEVGADREQVWQVILADALGPYQPAEEGR